MKSVVAGLQKLMTVESHHQSWSSCNTGEVARDLNVDHSMVIWHLKQIGKVKNLDKLVPHELTKNKKNFFKSFFWCVLLYATTTNHFSIGLWHETKRLYTTMAMTSSVVGPRRSFKELPKAKFEPQKMSWPLFGGLLPIWSTPALWIPAKALHLRSILSKSVRCTTNWNTWSQHWSAERARFSSTTVPDLMLHNQRFKSWTNWAMKFCLICHIRLTSQHLTTTSSSISTTLYKENASTTSRRQKMLSKSALKHAFLCFRNNQTYFSLAKMCWLQWLIILILINQDVFEPSYNDLKFTFQNCLHQPNI